MRKTKTIFPYILLSIVAAVLTIIMILTKSSNSITLGDKIIVTGTFISSCMFGISIAIHPNWWKRFQVDRSSSLQSEKTIISFRGHHPNCDMFKSHSIIIKNKPRCTGCLGLIIGSILSILFIVIFLFILPILSLNTLYLIFALGLILLFLVYAEIIFPKRYASTHTIFNIVLVLGFFCLTLSILEITGDLIYGILTIILCFLWLDTRIQLSNWNHIRICNSCPESCKTYEA